MDYRRDGDAVVGNTFVKMREFEGEEVLCEWVEDMKPTTRWFRKDLVRPIPTAEEQEAHRQRETSYNSFT